MLMNANECADFKVFGIDIRFFDLAPLDFRLDNLTFGNLRRRWRFLFAPAEKILGRSATRQPEGHYRLVLEKEGETDFPFFYFLVVVTAREYHVALVLCSEDEAPRRVNTEACSRMSDLVCTILTLNDG